MEAVDDERLMAAIGRIAVRAAELGEQIDLILRRLRPNEPAGKWHKLPLGLKLNEAIKASNNGLMQANAGLRMALVEFCNDCLSLLVPNRNSAIHSTYILDDDGVIKWDSLKDPKIVTPDELNEVAAKFHAAESRAITLGMEIRDFFSSKIVTSRYA
jgi:hypothetical protein